MTAFERLLGLGVGALRPLLPLLGLASAKAARGVAERRGVVRRLRKWSRAARDPDRPLLWLHGASAGELLGAAPALTRLRELARVQVFVTYFSPSAETALEWLAPAGADVLPLDTPGETRRSLEALRPDALVFAKGDVWPNLTREAAATGVPLGMVNGTVAEDSSRLRWPARRLLRPAYGRLERVGAVTDEDARRLTRLGVAPGAVAVTGDGSFDWALQRIHAARRESGSAADELRRLRPGGLPVLVAGSTWRDDERVLVEAVARREEAGRPVWLVVVPHEPGPEAVASFRRLCAHRLGREPVLWSERAGTMPSGGAGDPDGPRPLLVDAVGVLAEMYEAADVAWVGGGFGADGLHSVVEPAAAGVPVLFGPRGSRREAVELVERGGARRVDAASAADVLAGLLDDAEERSAAGRAARAYVEERSGAAERNARLVLELLPAEAGR